MLDPLTLLDLSFRVLVSVALGAAIGLERQWRLRTAGIRTNALVSAGSALFVMIGAVGLGEDPAADPTRVAAQVVSGIGFLGAGVILRDGGNIRGLTTAATLWCAAAVGSLSGAGLEELAVIGAVAIVATNTLLRPLSRAVNRRMSSRGDLELAAAAAVEEEAVPAEFMLEVVTSEKSDARVRALVLQAVGQPEYELHSLDIRAGRGTQITVLASVRAQSPGDTGGLERAVQRISLDPKVTSSRWWPAETDD